jgi:hypothetical protein
MPMMLMMKVRTTLPSHNCTTVTLSTEYIIGLIIMKIEAIMVFHEDVFTADLQCAMTRPEML